MDGMLGIAGWRWLFIMEGIPTVVFGIYMYYTLADGPDSNGLLSAEEQGWLLQRYVCTSWGWDGDGMCVCCIHTPCTPDPTYTLYHADCKQTRAQVGWVHQQHAAHGRVLATGARGTVRILAFKMQLPSMYARPMGKMGCACTMWVVNIVAF